MKLTKSVVELILRGNRKDGYKIFIRLKDTAIYVRYRIFNSEHREYEFLRRFPMLIKKKSNFADEIFLSRSANESWESVG